MNNTEKYLTLKEAAQMSGYTSDYIGQLIRKGRLPGKQVYHSVAWVISKDDLDEYIRLNQNGEKEQGEHNGEKARGIFAPGIIMSWIMWATIIMLSAFIILLFYILSANLEKKMQQNAAQEVQKASIGASIVITSKEASANK
jgi:excisionase family DNA binding protein